MSNKIEELCKIIRDGKIKESESIWIEILEKDGFQDMDHLKKVSYEFYKKGQKKRLLDLLTLTAVKFAEKKSYNNWLETLKIIDSYNPNKNKILINKIADSFLKLYPNTFLQKWIKNIKNQEITLTKFINAVEKSLLFKEGMYVKHKSGWGLGKITKIDKENAELIVNLEKRRNHKMEIFAATECLIILEPDSFEVLYKFNKERLKELAQKSPKELIYKLLKYLGEASSKDIKESLCPEIIKKKNWSKWWGNLRKNLVLDPYIEFKSPSIYILRDKPLDWEEETKNKFNNTDDLNKPLIVLEYLKHTKKFSYLLYFIEELKNLYHKYIKENKPWYSLECYIVMEEALKYSKNNEEIKEIINSLDIKELFELKDPINIYLNIRHISFARKTLKYFIEYTSDWEKYITTIFLTSSSDIARDTLFNYILKNKNIEKEKIGEIGEEIFKNAFDYPEALGWLVRQYLNNKISLKHNLVEIIKLLINTGQSLNLLNDKKNLKKLNKVFNKAIALKIVKKIKDKEDAKELLNFIKVAELDWLPSGFYSTLKESLEKKAIRNK